MSDKRLGWSLDYRDPETIKKVMPFWEFLYKYYFQVKTDGWEYIPNTQVLFVGSHNGGLGAPDMTMMMYDWFKRFGVEKPVYGLMHPSAWKVYSTVIDLAAQCGAVVAHPKMAIRAIESGASVLVYPGGAEDVFRPYSERDKIKLVGRKAFIKLALKYSLPIVPLVSKGAHETLYVLTDLYEQAKSFHDLGWFDWILDVDPQTFPIYLGLPWGIAFGPLPNIPLPNPIRTRVCPPIYFKHYGMDASKDKDYVDECYDMVEKSMQYQLDLLYDNSNDKYAML
ncbi:MULTISPECIES: glycerol acyltransferase [unclassified Cyanobacterium]|uniref:glycerol acyltransferase n=1 Tax=unclassified Cyanobacterium TaxID=2629879 RepID=UPI000852729D|nr:glycerol acyltransferase [Cyanobacterium sp. IPPAS B-1200]OEJ78102.1 glycerol acyltransferase [Cyanobacterium sp. IPPAS B-1200]